MQIMLDEGAKMPTRAYENDAGLDIYSRERQVMFPKSRANFKTGVHVQIPKGYVGFLKSKSGLNKNHGIIGEGVIDAGYTGEINVMLHNNSNEIYIIEKGDKITQLVILPIVTPHLTLVNSFDETERGDNGFGSTGR